MGCFYPCRNVKDFVLTIKYDGVFYFVVCTWSRGKNLPHFATNTVPKLAIYTAPFTWEFLSPGCSFTQKVKSVSGQVVHTAGAYPGGYPGFRSMKGLEYLYSPLDGMAGTVPLKRSKLHVDSWILADEFTARIFTCFVQVNPSVDLHGATSILAANFLYEMMCVLPGVIYKDAPSSDIQF